MLLKDALYPLQNLHQFYSFIFLIQNSDEDLNYVSESFNSIYGTQYNVDSISILKSKFLHLFSFDHSDLNALFSNLSLKALNKKQYLLPPISQCISCKFFLEFSSTHKIIAYCFDSPKIMYFQVKRCARCNIDFSFRNYTYCSSSQSYLYPSSIKISHIATSKETCFEIKLLKYFNEQIIRNGVTFEGFTDSYNRLYPEAVNGRPLDRRRLAEAWYSYNIKQLLFKENISTPILDFKSDSKSTEVFLSNNIISWKISHAIKWSELHKRNCTCLNCENTCLYSFYCYYVNFFIMYF
jgi:hypothetical protein